MLSGMGHRLIGFMLCATLPAWADVCAGLLPAPAQGGSFEEGTRSIAFRLSVKEGQPAYRIVIRPIRFNQPKSNEPAHSGDIEVARCEDGKTIQLLPLDAWQRMNFAPTFHAQDVNFDGYLDLAILTEFGAKWGSHEWWIFDPASGKFVQNELTRELRNLKAADYKLNAKQREISTRQLTESWGCGSTGDRYRVANDGLTLIHKEVAKASGERCAVTVSDLVNGAMRVTGVRKFVKGRLVD
jgi:hypothetical protein